MLNIGSKEGKNKQLVGGGPWVGDSWFQEWRLTSDGLDCLVWEGVWLEGG
jgi:hypothetical protein